MDNSGAILSVSDLTYAHKGRTLLEGVTFQVSPGEILGVIGPNGAGKTTLLKLLSGEWSLTQGTMTVSVMGAEACQVPRAKWLGVLPQFSPLSFPLPVEEVILLGRTPHNTGLEYDLNVVQSVMAALDIQHLMGRPYTHLSGGEKQRAQLARVLAQVWHDDVTYPQLLLLDEPTGALDIGHKQQLMQVLRRWADKGGAVVLVEHDIQLTLSYSDTVMVLAGGQVKALGSPSAVVTPTLMAEVFNANAALVAHPVTGAPTLCL